MAYRPGVVSVVRALLGRGDARASAHKRGYDEEWEAIRAAKLAKDPFCEEEGCDDLAIDVHHKIPKRDGGTNHRSNLQSLCHSHHSKKTQAGG